MSKVTIEDIEWVNVYLKNYTKPKELIYPYAINRKYVDDLIKLGIMEEINGEYYMFGYKVPVLDYLPNDILSFEMPSNMSYIAEIKEED